MNIEKFIRMPLSELTTPKGGRICIANHWWAITCTDEALFYKSYCSPQCNSDKRIVERVLTVDGTHPVFVPVAFVPHNCADYA